MDISSTTSSWCMGNQFLFDQLPFDSIYPTEENPLQIHPTQSTTHVPNSSVAVVGQRTDQREEEEEEDELGSMKEMMYKIAAMQPVDIDPATIEKPKRRNVRISDDPQSIAARRRRERISERIRILQRLVPGGTKMDTATMLDEAARYMKFLKKLVQELQTHQPAMGVAGLSTTADRSSGAVALGPYSSMGAPQGTRFSYT